MRLNPKITRYIAAVTLPFVIAVSTAKADQNACYDESMSLIKIHGEMYDNQEKVRFLNGNDDCDMMYVIKKELTLQKKEQSALESVVDCMGKNPDAELNALLPFEYKTKKAIKDDLADSPHRIAESNFKLGSIYEVCGGKEKAKEYFGEALRLEPLNEVYGIVFGKIK